jgi:hypothetical protein
MGLRVVQITVIDPYLILRSQPTTPERNRAQARDEDRAQQAMVSPDGRRIPMIVPPAAQAGPANPPQALTNRQIGQRARQAQALQRQTAANRGGGPNVQQVRTWPIHLITTGAYICKLGPTHCKATSSTSTERA